MTCQENIEAIYLSGFSGTREGTSNLSPRSGQASKGQVRRAVQALHGAREEVRRESGHRERHLEETEITIRRRNCDKSYEL